MLKQTNLFFVAVFVSSGFAFSEETGPRLDAKNRAEWRIHIQPDEKDAAWEQIDWKPDLASGIAAASASRKPILLWTMNGHPLGCT
jgi:hypothetical protein